MKSEWARTRRSTPNGATAVRDGELACRSDRYAVMHGISSKTAEQIEFPMPFPPQELQADHLLTPREVANIFGVRAATVARWAREGRLDHMLTPGGHRRYRLAAVRELIQMTESELGPENVERQKLEQDELAGHVVRLASDVTAFVRPLVVDQPATGIQGDLLLSAQSRRVHTRSAPV
jgi:excisionase family DNA binding protein